jgi:hypothetical protein
MGFRSREAATRLIADGHVRPSYGRKGHLRAIWLLQEDGGNPVETQAPRGTKYSFLQKLDNGKQCWQHRRVERRDDDGVPVDTRSVFLEVVTGCMVP